MFIQKAPSAIFACTFLKTLFISTATANPTLHGIDLHYSKGIYLKTMPYVFFFFLKTFLVNTFTEW